MAGCRSTPKYLGGTYRNEFYDSRFENFRIIRAKRRILSVPVSFVHYFSICLLDCTLLYFVVFFILHFTIIYCYLPDSSLNTCIFRIDSYLIGMFPTPYEYYEKRSKLDRFKSIFLRLIER